MDLSGARCGGYEVWGPIGQGGMSRVWLARHAELSVPAVLKTLLDVTEVEALLRLRNEARLMARIPSAHVVRAVDVGVYEDIPYLVQEYVDGLDLAELDRSRRRAVGRGLPLWFVCRVASEVAEALHAAHQTGVLHRDVKPSNLFGSPQTGTRLGDFGIAMGRGVDVDRSTGTLRFIAPEALRGQAPTRQSDVYSLGATAFDLYYGTPPFTELRQIVGDAELVLPDAKSAEEAYFQHVLKRMLARERTERFPTIKEPLRLFTSLARSLTPRIVATHVGPGVYQLGRLRVSCVLGDIADQECDGIVNSANDEMRMRTGTGAALRGRGGDTIEDEAMSGGRRALGECVATTAGDLKCKIVLHAVSAWREASCIARTCQRALLMAEELDLRTLAIPALGTGVARVAPEACAYAVASALLQHVLLGGSRLRDVRFVLYDRETHDLFVEQINGVLLGESEIAEQELSIGVADPAYDETLHFPVAPMSTRTPR
jgi:serine/threonine-protein kinase